MVSGLIGDLYAKYNSERSFFGYAPQVLKSGIQKYGRRAGVDTRSVELEKGLWCLIEMDLLSLLEWDGAALNAYLQKHPQELRVNTQQSAQAKRTNMVNRLVVMMSEEVNISAWWMPVKMKELYQTWWEYRNSPLSRKLLVDMYLYLVSQRMIRLISDLKSVYVLPPYYEEPKQMPDFWKIHRNIEALYPAVYSDQAKVGDIDWDLTDYPKNLRPVIKGIVYNLEAGCDYAFYWISKLCDLEKADGRAN